MKVTILGIQNTTYPDKKTGELKESFEFTYSTPYKNTDNAVGSAVGTERFSKQAFPEQFALFEKSAAKLIGKTAIISKNVRTIGEKTWAYIEELEVLV